MPALVGERSAGAGHRVLTGCRVRRHRDRRTILASAPPPVASRSAMTQNHILSVLSAAGVSVWLDDLSRDRLTSGNLQQLIDARSGVGVTTNPSMQGRGALRREL